MAKTFKIRVSKSQTFWSAVCFIAVVIVGTLYVLQMASVTKQGYQMRELETSVGALELENELLSVQVSEAKSLSNVSERMQILGFTDTNDTIYLTDLSAVARNQ